MELRTLSISTDIPGFVYQYYICTKSFLGVCTKHELHRDLYDLRDPAVRQKLHDMNFVARVREKP